MRIMNMFCGMASHRKECDKTVNLELIAKQRCADSHIVNAFHSLLRQLEQIKSNDIWIN